MCVLHNCMVIKLSPRSNDGAFTWKDSQSLIAQRFKKSAEEEEAENVCNLTIACTQEFAKIGRFNLLDWLVSNT